MILKRLNHSALDGARRSAALGDEASTISRFRAKIAAISNGQGKLVDTPFLAAAARALNAGAGKSAGRLVAFGLRNRSKKIFSQVRPFIEKESMVLDLGCGDGKVGELAASELGCKVTLMDVVNYHRTSLPFHRYNGRETRFRDEQFDHVLLVTVLHHSDDPIKVMSEALRVASKSVIVIESVYFNEPHRIANSFFDWFYNRVLNNPDINVPLNFLPPKAWVALFNELGGDVKQMEHLGIDIPVVPEWHTLFVVGKSQD